MHSRSPCVCSTFVQGILDLPNERKSAEETDTLVNKLIDAWLCGRTRVMRHFFGPNHHRAQMEWAIDSPYGSYVEWEPLHETLNLALAMSAIYRNDCSELRTLLDQGVDLAQESVRFGILPLAEATFFGSQEITEILVANNCPVIFGGITELYPTTNAISIHMTRRNKEGLRAWVDHLKRSAQDISEYFDPWEIVTFASPEMVEFIDDEYGHELDRPLLRGKMFKDAIYSKDVNEMPAYIGSRWSGYQQIGG